MPKKENELNWIQSNPTQQNQKSVDRESHHKDLHGGGVVYLIVYFKLLCL